MKGNETMKHEGRNVKTERHKETRSKRETYRNGLANKEWELAKEY
jgi:hypothetical protein